ncbi:homeobox-leucine zipper protein HOX27-like [Panicum miliaceum]|uniref:Homeobox-leucine zipper protein HOX27-like n=1 Tax=Panicum miliaceum TaxID=4540 RepID=A0A3L6RID5_PANMI|nr:homeobox-leucine zipper protein HOX27-like [Panicum miliaceum]
MELGLSLGEPDAGRAAPELGLGLGVGAAGRGEDGGRGSAAAGPGARWWTAPVAEPEPAVRLSLVSSLGLQWPPPSSDCGGRSTEAPARGFDVNRAPSAAASASAFAALEEDDDEEDPGAGALSSSSPNDSAGSFPLDLGRRARGHAEGAAAARAGGERSSSRASDEDEGASAARKKLRLSKEQSAFLEESFKEHSTLNPRTSIATSFLVLTLTELAGGGVQKQKAALARQLNLRPRQVEVWFQNRRARTKLKQTEVDCEYLKRCCEALTEENRRLHKEIAELRALKSAPPFYMHLPATTLSMCPSCERVASNPISSSAPASSAPPSTAAAANNNNNNKSAAAVAAPARGEHRPSSFAALFAATRSFPLASQPRPPAPASNCL